MASPELTEIPYTGLLSSILELTKEIENLEEQPLTGGPRKVLWAKKRFPRQGIRCVGPTQGKRRKYIGATAKDFPWCILRKSPRTTNNHLCISKPAQTGNKTCRRAGSTETRQETESASSGQSPSAERAIFPAAAAAAGGGGGGGGAAQIKAKNQHNSIENYALSRKVDRMSVDYDSGDSLITNNPNPDQTRNAVAVSISTVSRPRRPRRSCRPRRYRSSSSSSRSSSSSSSSCDSSNLQRKNKVINEVNNKVINEVNNDNNNNNNDTILIKVRSDDHDVNAEDDRPNETKSDPNPVEPKRKCDNRGIRFNDEVDDEVDDDSGTFRRDVVKLETDNQSVEAFNKRVDVDEVRKPTTTTITTTKTKTKKKKLTAVRNRICKSGNCKRTKRTSNLKVAAAAAAAAAVSDQSQDVAQCAIMQRTSQITGWRRSLRRPIVARSKLTASGNAVSCSAGKKCFVCGDSNATERRTDEHHSQVECSPSDQNANRCQKSNSWTKEQWKDFFSVFTAVAAEARTLQCLGSDNMVANKRWLDCMRKLLHKPPF